MSKLYQNLTLLSKKELESFSAWLNYSFHEKGEKEKVLFSLIYSNKKLIKNREQIRVALSAIYKQKKKITPTYFNGLEHSLLGALEDFFAFQAIKEESEIRNLAILKFLQKKDSSSLISKRFKKEIEVLQNCVPESGDVHVSLLENEKSKFIQAHKVSSYRFLYELVVCLQHISARENNMGKEDWMVEANHFHNISWLLEKAQVALAYAAHKHANEITTFDLFPIETIHTSLQEFFQKGNFSRKAYPYLDYLEQMCDLLIKTLGKRSSEIPQGIGVLLLDRLIDFIQTKNKEAKMDDIQNMYFLLYNLRAKIRNQLVDAPGELENLGELRYILEKGIEHKLVYVDETIPEVILKNLVKYYLRIEELSGQEILDNFDWQNFLKETPAQQREITERLLKAMIHFEKKQYHEVVELSKYGTKVVRKTDINLRVMGLQSAYMLPECDIAFLLQRIESFRRNLIRVMGRKDLGRPYCQKWILFLDIFRKTITAKDLASLERKNLLNQINAAAQKIWLRQIILQRMETLS